MTFNELLDKAIELEVQNRVHEVTITLIDNVINCLDMKEPPARIISRLQSIKRSLK